MPIWHWPGDGGADGNGKGVGMWRDWKEEVREVWLRHGGAGGLARDWLHTEVKENPRNVAILGDWGCGSLHGE